MLDGTRQRRGRFLCGLGVALATLISSMALPTSAVAQQQQQRLRIVGSLAGVSMYTKLEEPFWTRELARLSEGRFSASIVPFDRAGIQAQDMLRLIKLGVAPFGTTLLSQLAVDQPELAAADLAGLNPDMPTLKRVVEAFRPYLENSLRTRHGVELLAVYLYPAQAIFCRHPLASLEGLRARRVRVSSATQADFVRALGGVPVYTEFSALMPNMRNGSTECAITGTMSGNMLGLHEVAEHLYSMPVTWGLAIFSAQTQAWSALPAELKALLRQELPKLEAEAWKQAERETSDGIACNIGAASCTAGRKGAMKEVRPSAADDQRRREIFARDVLPAWVGRCGPELACADVWNNSIAPIVGVKAPSPR